MDTGKTEHPTSDQFGNSTPEKIVCKANTYLDQQNQVEKMQILSVTIIMPYIICKHTSMYTLYTQYIITYMYKIHTCLLYIYIYIYIYIYTYIIYMYIIVCISYCGENAEPSTSVLTEVSNTQKYNTKSAS